MRGGLVVICNTRRWNNLPANQQSLQTNSTLPGNTRNVAATRRRFALSQTESIGQHQTSRLTFCRQNLRPLANRNFQRQVSFTASHDHLGLRPDMCFFHEPPQIAGISNGLAIPF
jgi:hypothetical protein